MPEMLKTLKMPEVLKCNVHMGNKPYEIFFYDLCVKKFRSWLKKEIDLSIKYFFCDFPQRGSTFIDTIEILK